MPCTELAALFLLSTASLSAAAWLPMALEMAPAQSEIRMHILYKVRYILRSLGWLSHAADQPNGICMPEPQPD